MTFDQLASKDDLGNLEQRLTATIESVELRLHAAIADSRTDMIKWFAGVLVAQGLGIVVATVTITKLLIGGHVP